MHLAAIGLTSFRTASGWMRRLRGMPADAAPSSLPPEGGVEAVREAMLGCLDAAARHLRPRLVARITFACDAKALWYLRSELMLTLAELRGEEQALRELTWINGLFDGLVPTPMTSRPMPLR